MFYLLAWVSLGLLVGLVGNRIMNREGNTVFTDAGTGIAGAVVGGLLFRFLGTIGVLGFNLWSLLGAMAVASLALALAQLGRRTLQPA